MFRSIRTLVGCFEVGHRRISYYSYVFECACEKIELTHQSSCFHDITAQDNANFKKGKPLSIDLKNNVQ